MAKYKSSCNFIWDTNKCIGKGATSEVFFGREKKNGLPVAVKCFTPPGMTQLNTLDKRELEVLKTIEHENVVKLIAIEEETTHHRYPVIITELSTEGNVLSQLSKPINMHGFQEDEFLCFLQHIACGMKYLRQKGIVHRDIKPGNILRFIKDDGRSLYKLSDFGAARVLPESGQFTSIYGTEEYLHPGMFETRLLHKASDGKFDASCDIWSLGVTLFHVATGNLPFQPVGSRENRDIMFKMTANKEHGVICCYQQSKGGEIMYSKELPRTCSFSQSFKNELVTMLAGLMEVQEKYSWKFEKFYKVADELSAKIIVYLFISHTNRFIRLYTDSGITLIDLKQIIEANSGLPSSDQLLFMSNGSLLDETVMLNQFSGVSSENPIILVPLSLSEEISAFNPPYIDETPNSVEDMLYLKSCLAIMYSILRAVKTEACKQKLTVLSSSLYGAYVKSKVLNLSNKIKYTSQVLNQQIISNAGVRKPYDSLLLSVGDLEKSQSFTVLSLLCDNVNNVEKQIIELRDETLLKIEELLSFCDSIKVEDGLKNTSILCTENDRCNNKIQVAIDSAKLCLERVKEIKCRPYLSNNDKSIIVVEKKCILKKLQDADNLLKNHCVSRSSCLHEEYNKWLRDLSVKMADLEDCQKKYSELCDSEESMSDLMLQITSFNLIQLITNSNTFFALNASKDKLGTDCMDSQRSMCDLSNALQVENAMGPASDILRSMERSENLMKSLMGPDHHCHSLNELYDSMEPLIRSPIPRLAPRNELDTDIELYIKSLNFNREYIQKSDINVNDADANGRTPLFYACISGNIAAVTSLLKANAKVSSQDIYGNTCIHYSSLICNTDTIKMLLAHDGDSIRIVNNQQQTCLHLAAISGKAEMLRLLVQPDIVNLADLYGNTPLHLASKFGLTTAVNFLLDLRTVHVNALNYCNKTPLHLAAKYGRVKSLKRLLQREDIKLTLTDSNGCTALMESVKRGHMDVAKILLDKSGLPSVRDVEGKTILHLACSRKRIDIIISLLKHKDIKQIINKRDFTGSCALHELVKLNDLDLVKLAITSGADVNCEDCLGRKPLNISKLCNEIIFDYLESMSIENKAAT